MSEPKTKPGPLAGNVQVLSVVVGVVMSVLSFNHTRVKEAEARAIAADLPFVELRRKTYLEAAKTAAIIANPEGRSPDELSTAKRRFRELYVSELTMVEDPEVARKMVALAAAVDPDLKELTPAQRAALELAQSLQAGYTNSRAE